MFSGLQWEQIKGSREGLRELVSANENIYGAKADEIFRVSLAAMLAFGSFFSGKASGFIHQTGHVNFTPSHCMATIVSPCFSFLFPAVLTSLSFSGLDEVKPNWDLCVVPQKARVDGSSPILSFLTRGTHSIWVVPSWH